MNAEYFHARTCILLGGFARDILDSLGVAYRGTDIEGACDALESPRHASAVPLVNEFVAAVDVIVEAFLNALAVECAADCMCHPKWRRKSDGVPLDRWNMHIQRGYTNDVFVLCGGLE